MVKAEVITNCTEDPYWRVKVKSDGIWEESQLIPSLNSVYLEKGDTVLIEMTGMSDPVIMGKLMDASQKSKNPMGGSPVLFQAKNGSKWIAAIVKEGRLEIKTSDGAEVLIEGGALDMEVETVDIKATKITIKGDNIEVVGSVLHKGVASPNAKGAFCGLPNCLFSGAPHSSDQTIE